MEVREAVRTAVNGWTVVAGVLAMLGLLCWWFYWDVTSGRIEHHLGDLPLMGLLLAAIVFTCVGFLMLQPNTAAVLTLFGNYQGTVRQTGLLWVNPLYAKHHMSLRVRNFASEKIKVNDLRGNPIDIACIVVWYIEDTAQAKFQVDNYLNFVTVQSEAALRHIAMSHPYDVFDGDTTSLRGSTGEISLGLEKEIQERVETAGVRIREARLSHLAYAQEIAEVMLQRQQADAVVAARSRIVDGAVGMVEMALAKLEEKQTVQLDEERKAAMVSNLLVVLCAHEAVRPVINAGTLYS